MDGRHIDAFSANHPSVVNPQWIQYTPSYGYNSATTTYTSWGRYMFLNTKLILVEIEIVVTASSQNPAVPISSVTVPVNSVVSKLFPFGNPPSTFSGCLFTNGGSTGPFALACFLQPPTTTQSIQFCRYDNISVEITTLNHRLLISGHYSII